MSRRMRAVAGLFAESGGKGVSDLNLPADWLNGGPAMQFRMGLPDGLQSRLLCDVIGEKLTVYYISRPDQIYFKTYAAADRGGYHVSDLRPKFHG